MKQLFFLIAVLALVTFSCKPDGPNRTDEIVFQDFVPDLEVQTVNSISTYIGGAGCSADVPSPVDSTATLELDLDEDGKADFAIAVKHWKDNPTNYCGHCPWYVYEVEIKGLESRNLIAYNSATDRTSALILDSLFVINENFYWDQEVGIYTHGGCATSSKVPEFTIASNSGYIALRIGKSYGYIRIAATGIHGVKVLEQGFNETRRNNILAGQRE